MLKLILCITFAYTLLGCGGGGGSGGTSSSTPIEAATWPPKSGTEFLAHVNNKVYKRVGADTTLTFSGGQMVYNGPYSTYHTATIFTSNTTKYTQPYSCHYEANDLQSTGFDSNGFTFQFNVTSTNDFEPGGIDHCKGPNCPSCNYYEWATIDFTADSKCIVYDGELFCTAN